MTYFRVVVRLDPKEARKAIDPAENGTTAIRVDKSPASRLGVLDVNARWARNRLFENLHLATLHALQQADVLVHESAG